MKGSILCFNIFLILQCVVTLININVGCDYSSEIKSCHWKMSSSYENSGAKCELNKILENICLQIKPPNDIYLKGRKIAKKIYKILKRSHYDVDRYTIAGSFGKGTAVSNRSDFDIVVFINNIEPPYPTVIQEIKKVLNNNSDKFENYKYRGTTGMLIKIKVSEIRFDIIPTADYKKPNSSNYKETFLKIQKLANPFVYYYHYNSGLSAEAASFGKRRSAFVHSVVRLAKYWNGKIYLTEYFHGRSFIMELIAIKACEGVPENNFYLAFKKFLNMIADFEHLHIIFEDYYKISEIPQFLLQYRGPIILDPVNYYSNIVHHWNMPQSAIMKYKVNAKISLGELEKWKVDSCINTKFFKNTFIKNYSHAYQIHFESDCQPSDYYAANYDFSNPGKYYSA